MSCTRLRFGLQTHLPAGTKILFVLEYCRVRQWPALEAEAGLPQMACLVSTFHTTMLETHRKHLTHSNREYVQLREFTYCVCL